MRKLERRSLLLGGAGMAALAACGATHHAAAAPPTSAPATRSPGTSATPHVTATPTAAAPPTEADWATLARQLTGRLLRPGASGYAAGVQLYDPRFDTVRPQGLAFCASSSDVARALAFAREHAIPVAARSGGHSYAGYSTSTGLVLDVTAMNTATPVAGGRAVVGAGTRLIDLYSQLGAQGVFVPGGSCATVGIAGLALGGGQGVTGRAYGLTCDQLRSVTIVTADSVVRTVTPSDPTGLFWACTGGGGGNFGVVTSFTFATVPAPSMVLFTLRFPWAAADQVLPAWQTWAPAQPDELWSNCLLLAHPSPDDGVPLLQVGGAWLGPPAQLSGLLASLTTAAGVAPSQTFSDPNTFLEAMFDEAGCLGLTAEQCHLPTQTPDGQLTRSPVQARSDYLARTLPAAGVRAVVEAVNERQAASLGQGGVAYDSYGGAINRVAPGATAFVHRDMACCAQYTASFSPGASAAELAGNAAWLDTFYASQRPYVSGQAYQNYIDPALTDWQQAYYAGNLARLEQVKAHYDPDRVFTFPQAIPAAR